MTNSKPQTPSKWVVSLPICFFMLILIYWLSASKYPHFVSNKLFGVAINERTTFNALLFCQLFFVGFIIIGTFSLTAKRFTFGSLFLMIMLSISIFTFILGINLPLISTTSFWVFKEKYSLIQMLQNLNAKNEYFLFWIVLIFTFIIPTFKNLFLWYSLFVSKNEYINNHFISIISKWSMLDILVVATLIACIKANSRVFSIDSSAGLIYFSLATLTSFVITGILSFRYSKHR